MTNPMDFPALTGDYVTEAHAQICRERGHATYKINEVPQTCCPRCGDALTSDVEVTVTTTEHAFTETELDAMWHEEYERMYERPALRNVPIRAGTPRASVGHQRVGHNPHKDPARSHAVLGET
jgi:hypothetical protein